MRPNLSRGGQRAKCTTHTKSPQPPTCTHQVHLQMPLRIIRTMLESNQVATRRDQLIPWQGPRIAEQFSGQLHAGPAHQENQHQRQSSGIPATPHGVAMKCTGLQHGWEGWDRGQPDAHAKPPLCSHKPCHQLPDACTKPQLLTTPDALGLTAQAAQRTTGWAITLVQLGLASGGCLSPGQVGENGSSHQGDSGVPQRRPHAQTVLILKLRPPACMSEH